MTTLNQYPDVPCAYPNTVGSNITTGIGNTPKVLAVFRNDSSITSLRGIMQRFAMTIFNPTGDSLVTIQFVGGGTAVGGTWNPVGGQSMFDINVTATEYTGGAVALTLADFVVLANKTLPSALTPVDATSLGLELKDGGATFAIVAFTEAVGETVDMEWTVNWLEKD